LLSFTHAALHGCGNDFSGFDGQDRVWGKPNVACAAIEQLVSTPHGRDISGNYDFFIAISRWNENFLKSLDVGPVFSSVIRASIPPCSSPDRAAIMARAFRHFFGRKI